MKWENFVTPENKTTFIPGDWNIIDDITGRKVKASKTTKQWDGFRSTKSQKRHEQDFLRSHPERIRTPWSRPEPPDEFVNVGAVVTNGTFVTDTGWTLGSSWSIANGFASYLAGSTDTMHQSVNAVVDKKYLVTFTVFNYVGSGNVTASIGTANGTARTGNGTFSEEITSSGTNPDRLTFTPGSGGTSFNIDKVRVLRVG